jgi:predicted ArsR family transcriptional regulator
MWAVDQGDQRLAALAALNEPQRQRLYRHVAAQDVPVSRDDAAEALGIPRSVAAFHLEKLAELGLLDVEYRRPSGRTGPGAGRPAKLYRRAETEIVLSVPDRHYDLAALLLAEGVEAATDGSVGVDEAVRVAARRYGKQIGTSASSVGRLSQKKRVEHLMELLTANGYEPHAVGGTITLGNCPFHALAEEHRALICAMNLELVRGVVQAVGLDEEVAQQTPVPGRCCVSVRP